MNIHLTIEMITIKYCNFWRVISTLFVCNKGYPIVGRVLKDYITFLFFPSPTETLINITG